MNSGPTRVAVVGAGAFGWNHLRVYRELELAGYPVELVAVIDPNEAARTAAETQYGVRGFTRRAGRGSRWWTSSARRVP